MRLQHMTIIFIAIFLPILLITSYYIQQQVDTVVLEESYDAKLLDATHDAMSAFEINTANENLSTVADSLRSIIDASNNIFFNTLATNMGVSNASKSYVQPYIPAILYTLYDGYYIYAPTNTPEVCTDKFGQTISTDSYGVKYVKTIQEAGKTIGIYNFKQDTIKYTETTANGVKDGAYTVNFNDLPDAIKYEYGQLLYKNKDGTYSTQLHTQTEPVTKFKQSYILKSFVPYSAYYKSDDNKINVNINYTLDNFITIEGEVNGIYYTKSGYLSESDLIKKIHIIFEDGSENDVGDWHTYSDFEWHKLIYESNAKVRVTLADNVVISNDDKLEDSKSAIEYYIKSWIFSSWVYDNLGSLKESNVTDVGYELLDINTSAINGNLKDNKMSTNLHSKMMYDFTSDNDIIFRKKNPTKLETDIENIKASPENLESSFSIHKRNVIKNSITYNLVLSMVTYTEISRTTEFNFPVLSEKEWDRVLSNVSIISFMQGLKCGLKIYNNYAIVTSTNNEISVTPSEIYYVPYKDNNGNIVDITNISSTIETAHRIDCPELKKDDYYISFKSKEIKYDKEYKKSDNKYHYDHMVYTDYNCIVNSSYQDDDNRNGNTKILDYLHKKVEEGDDYYTKLKAYRIAIAKERNNLYKSIEFNDNLGIEILNINNNIEANYFETGMSYSRKINELSKIEIVISKVSNANSTVNVDDLILTLSGDTTKNYGSQKINVSSVKGEDTKLVLEFNKGFSLNNSIGKLKLTAQNSATKFIVKSIKFYYK